MISLISTCLLLVNAVASLALSQESTLKIVSPASGAIIQLGASLNVTLQIEKGSMKSSQQLLLGFGLNTVVSQKPTSLGEVFLGLLNTTKTPFNSSGHLTWTLGMPAWEKLNSTSSSFSLVVSQYMLSGATHTPGCGLTSVVVKVASQGSDSAAPGTSAGKPSLPAHPPVPMSHGTAASPKPTYPVAKAMNATSMSSTTPMANSPPAAHLNMLQPEIKASITAQGHNTADTIAGAPVGNTAGTAMGAKSIDTTPGPATGTKPVGTMSSGATGSGPATGTKSAGTMSGSATGTGPATGTKSAGTMPGSAMGNKPASASPSSSHDNMTSAPTSPFGKAGSGTPSSVKQNGTATASESESDAAHLRISTSHVIATLAVISGFFATV